MARTTAAKLVKPVSQPVGMASATAAASAAKQNVMREARSNMNKH